MPELRFVDPAKRFRDARANRVTDDSNALALRQSELNAPRQNALADLQLEQAQQGQAQQQRAAGVATEREKLRFLGQSAEALLQIPPDQRAAAFERLKPLAQSQGVDFSQFTPDQLTDQNLQNTVASVKGLSDNPQSLERLKVELRQKELASRDQLKRDAPALAGQTEAAKLQAQLGSKAKVAGQVETAKKQSALSAKVVEKSFADIGKARANTINLDRAIAALRKGGKTGPFAQFLPNLRAATRELSQIRSELGLDVVGGVTFGALSKGELDLALTTALDIGQDEDALIDILTRKRAAQEKVLANLQEAALFLSDINPETGVTNTVADFLRSKQSGSGQSFTSQSGITFTVE